MKKSTKQIQFTSSKVQYELLKHGVIIQFYQAYSTNSVYMKFDCGLANSLRIGDHNGYDHLSYMFRVDVNHDGYRKVERNKFTQYTYAPSKGQINKLVRHILSHREKRILQYGGIENYQKTMMEQYRNNKSNRGFWEQAVVLNADWSKETAECLLHFD